ncbi:MAG: TIGR02757 family protein [Bacteroidota bacterium]|nr:TIGR02757 family protein [Bacteroidota bacterium]
MKILANRSKVSDVNSVNQILCYFADKYNHPSFIPDDPISIPHRFTKKQDVEIMGFWIAMLSWGNRKSIIQKGLELCKLFENEPYEFIMAHSENSLKRFTQFVHRTFNPIDTYYFISFFKHWYQDHESLEDAFVPEISYSEIHVERALFSFYQNFFSVEGLENRTRKHVARPGGSSRCKRINMFLRWMVRYDTCGVDFGIWKKINPSQLLMPLDLHVERTSRLLGLIKQKNLDWKAVLEITNCCKKYDPADPVRFDFALFGISHSFKQDDFDSEVILRNIS